MEVNRLSQEELTYELIIRGLPTGKVDEMRTHLRSALKVEKEGKVITINPYPFTFDEDMQAVNKKIEEIKLLLETFQGEYGSSDYVKIQTKVEWALGRLNRVRTEKDEQIKEKSRARADLILALGSLRIKADGDGSGGESSADDEEDEPSMLRTTTVLPSARPRISLHKWDIKFSGEHGQSVNSFLERVIELAEARGVTKGQLFRSALDIFSGKALIWYRANKLKLHSWSDLVKELKREFLPADYDERLLEEIKRRTQGKDETIGMYIAMMSNMFARLTDPLTETQQLKILKKNISPFYQTQLGLTEIVTVQELIELGRRLESIRTSVEAFIPPPSRRNNQLLEPDLAYVATGSPSVASINNPRPLSDTRRCFKCGASGHFARFCRANLRCFRCGAGGVTCRRCPQCNENRQDDRAPRSNRPSTVHQPSPMSGNENGARN